MAKRKYRVTSRQNTLGRPTGTVFEADLTRLGYKEEDLIARGSLERVGRGEEKKEDAESTRRTD